MKKRILIVTVFFIISLMLIFKMGFSNFKMLDNYINSDPDYLIKERENIVGVWYSESDKSYKLEFSTSGVCTAYYENIFLTSYSYSISNTSPQCGIEVLVDSDQEQTSYLQLVEINNSSGGKCYEINGVGELLSLTSVDNGNLLIMSK